MSSGNENFDPYAQWLGLNLREQPLDHYLLLGLPRFERDPAVIEQHADERMRLVRSFQTGPRGRYTQKLMNELAAAKLCLLSPAAKRAYDEQLALWAQASQPISQSRAQHVDAHDLPPTAWTAATSGPMVLPPPVGPPDHEPPLPPAAPPIARGDEEEEADAVEQLQPGTGRTTLVVGLMLGLLSMMLAGWLVQEFVLRESPASLASSNNEPGAMSQAESPAEEPDDPLADAIQLPGTGRRELPDLDEAIEVLQEGSGDVVLSPATAVLAGGTELGLEGTEEVITGWSSPEDLATWQFRLIKPGFFQVQIVYAAGGEAFGRRVELAIDEQLKTLELQLTSEGYRTDLLTIAVPKSGPHQLQLRQTSAFDGELRVKLVRLQAVAK